MNYARDRAQVNRAMQQLPALSAEPPDPALGRGNRQRNQQHEARESDGNEPPFQHVCPHAGKIKKPVEPNPRGKMQARIEERKQPEHAAKTNELRYMKQFAKRSDAEGDNQKSNRPVASPVLDELNRIRAEFILKSFPHQHRERHKAK